MTVLSQNYDGWLDKEILEYASVLITLTQQIERHISHSVSENSTNALIDLSAELKGSLALCVSEMTNIDDAIVRN